MNFIQHENRHRTYGTYWFTVAEHLKENNIKFVFVTPMHVKRHKGV